MRLEVYKDYNHLETVEILKAQSFEVITTPVNEVDLTYVDTEAAMECIDGRHGKRKAKKHGAKIPGGSNFVASQITHGSIEEADELLMKKLGYTHGTHKRCGFFDAWVNRRIPHAQFELKIHSEQLQEHGHDLGKWVEYTAQRFGGRHFYLPGEHEENKGIINPHYGTTVKARSDALIYDSWVIPALGGDAKNALIAHAETIRAISPVRTLHLLIDPHMYY